MDCIGDVTHQTLSAEPPDECPLVLVVDDDDEIRELICDYLTGMGYRTRAAASGRDMWQQMDDGVDLVILDRERLSLCRGPAICRSSSARLRRAHHRP